MQGAALLPAGAAAAGRGIAVRLWEAVYHQPFPFSGCKVLGHQVEDVALHGRLPFTPVPPDLSLHLEQPIRESPWNSAGRSWAFPTLSFTSTHRKWRPAPRPLPRGLIQVWQRALRASQGRVHRDAGSHIYRPMKGGFLRHQFN